MVRELAISIYLFSFRILFNLFKLCPQKKKTVGVASFGDNIFYTTNALRRISDEEIIILKDRACTYPFDASTSDVISFDMKHPIDYIKSIYHLATATTILVDTYYGFLAVTNFKPGTTCIQLWHASGAIKQFGLLDPSIEYRSKQAKDRFQKVYDRFHYTTVGSEKMATIFHNSFGITNDRIIRTGVPRTDFFFDKDKKQRIYQSVKRNYPSIQGKKIILYAPTYRTNQLNYFQLELDVKQLYEALSNEYVLFIKFHPAVSYIFHNAYEDFVFDVTTYKSTNSLLQITDLLITDYSSVSFEYALLERPMLFYAYDRQEYKHASGLMDDYEQQMPGPVVTSTREIVKAIQEDTFDQNEIRKFSRDWNEYSKGQASLNVARFILGVEEDVKEKVYG